MLDPDYLVLVSILAAVWWIASAFAVMSAAERRGFGSGRWFWTSVLLGPILAALLLIAHPVDRSDSGDDGENRLSISPRS